MHFSDHLYNKFPTLGMAELFNKRNYLVFDNFLPESIVDALARECNNWHPDHPNPFGYFRNMRRFVEEAQSSSTLRWLESATGVEGIRGEPHLEHAGYGHGRQPWPNTPTSIAIDLHFGNLAKPVGHKRNNTAHNRCFISRGVLDYTGEVQGLRLRYT